MHRAVRRQPHRLAEALLGAVRQHRAGDQRVEAADAPVIAPLEHARAVAIAKVIQRLRVQPRAERVHDEHGRLVEGRQIEGRRRVRVVVIDDANALTWIAQPQLQVVVFELAVAGAAVQPARKPGVVGIDEVDLLERLQPERIADSTGCPAAETRRCASSASGDPRRSRRRRSRRPARHANQRRAGFIVGEVRNAQDIRIFGHQVPQPGSLTNRAREGGRQIPGQRAKGKGQRATS